MIKISSFSQVGGKCVEKSQNKIKKIFWMSPFPVTLIFMNENFTIFFFKSRSKYKFDRFLKILILNLVWSN